MRAALGRLRAALAAQWHPENWRPAHWFCAGIMFAIVTILLASSITAAVTDPDDLEPGEIVILSGRDDSLGGQRQALVDQWNELHPHSKARIIALPAIADAQRSEMLARAQAGGGIDVYNLDVTWTAEFADAGYIQSLDDTRLRTDGFLEGPLRTCRYAGRLWALPFNADVGMLYYRADLLRDLLDEDEAPEDWDTLTEQVQRVRARTTGVAGYVGQTGNYEGLTVTALELIWGAGGSVVDDDGRVLPGADDVAAVRTGLKRLGEIAGKDNIPELDEATSLEAFGSGKALFMRNWPVAYRSLGRNPAEGPPLEVGVAPLPAGSAALGGQNLAVAADTQRPRAAQALIEFLTSDRSQQLLLERGGLPATRAVVYHDPRVAASVPFVEKLREALDAARPRPAIPHYAQFSETFRTAVDGYLRGGEQLREDRLREALEAARLGRSVPVDDE